MQGVFAQHQVDAKAKLDMVQLQFGEYRGQLPYITAFELASSVRLAGKMASRHEGNDVSAWREFARVNPETRELTTHRGFRRSNLRGNVAKWKVAFEGALVSITLTDSKSNYTTINMHYSDALRWHTVCRLAAREAQAWAGDSNRAVRSVGYLNDAEENYKHGFNNARHGAAQ